MRYNLYYFSKGWSNTYTLLSSEDLDVVLNAYADGINDFFLNGEKVADFRDLTSIKIFKADITDDDFKKMDNQLKAKRRNPLSPVWSPESFREIGKEITKDKIGNKICGWRKGLTLINNSEQLTNSFWGLIHDRIKAVAKTRFDSKQYADAVEASFKELNDIIKQEYKSKTGNELDGQKLMNQAFSTTSPIFELVDLSNQSGQNVQDGYRFILAGSMGGIRNPTAHQNLVIDQNDAIEKIILASHLLKVFENRLNP